ncbi:MAG: type B 50S ribosomal protein L31 [Gammaproteobacteria bacterium]|nr:MAG: type B 50S ribosomal protein L31 [Gammaproteobacteria bacterium]
MRKDIHPEYREVLFHDKSVDVYFLVPSTLKTDETKEWEDGKTYPYCVLDISSASHPFYTGKQKLVDTGGRVDKFRKRFGNKSKATPAAEAPAEEAVAEEVVAEEAVAEEVVAEEAVSEEAVVEDAAEEETPTDEESSKE